ncbi:MULTISPECIES: hypothetical protein [Streptomyces]|uniref:hypothetical protein n=1 Tax=Streptomyces TaxID=1883 RepID=UPI001FCBC87E|nr:hypothetical protein [Streptomyces melanosporofaciens]
MHLVTSAVPALSCTKPSRFAITPHRSPREGPAVEGEWAVPGIAQGRYAEWVGLYGAHPSVVIRLIEGVDGHRRVRKTWTARGEVEGPAA